MKATWNQKVIAQSDRTRVVDGYAYFPREDVRMEVLQPSKRTASDLECPHGVQFYDVVDGTRTSERAAWSYEAPKSGMKSVERWIGFWEDVSVV